MKIKVINDGINQVLYDKYESTIFELANENYNILNLDVDVVVIVTKLSPNYNGACRRVRRKYQVELSEKLLELTERVDSTNNLDLVIFHELMHVKDACIVNGKKSSYKTQCRFYYSYDNFVINVGYNSWTEFHACFETFDISDAYKVEPTFLYMVKKFEKIIKFRDEIFNTSFTDEKVFNETLDEYFEKIHEFVYLSSRFIASIPFNRRRNRHCEKTRTKPEYKYLLHIYDKLINVFSKSLHGVYGKHLFTRLYKIGLIWINELYVPLNIYPIKKNEKVLFMFEK